VQDAKDQMQAVAEEQKALGQENQRLQRELAAAAAVLEAKRSKKRKWKAQCMANDSQTEELRQQLKDKQFAVEKAMQRFKALETRIETGTQLKDIADNSAPKLRNVADMEARLVQQQADCILLREQLQDAQDVLFHSSCSCSRTVYYLLLCWYMVGDVRLEASLLGLAVPRILSFCHALVLQLIPCSKKTRHKVS
jgi:predicted RNase H-like nuclease (RuvC/YqgF family)